MVCWRGSSPRSFVWPQLAFASATVGNAAPALDVPELDGQTFDLSAQRGKVVIVNFWATWCPPCREEMPALDAFYRRYHGQGLEMIGVSADRPHDRSDVIKVMQSYSYPAAMLDDAKVNDFGTPDALADDRCRGWKWSGARKAYTRPNPVTEKSLSDAVLPLLPQKSAAAQSPGDTTLSLESPGAEAVRTLILRLQCNCPVKSSEGQPMKKLALVAIILLAGCASSNIRTSDSDPRLAQFEKKRRAVAESEKQCIDETLSS